MKRTLLLFTVLFCFSVCMYAQPGALIPSFGTGGLVVKGDLGDFNSYSKIGIQPSGKLIVLNDYRRLSAGSYGVLMRYNTDGTIDNSFGYEGRAAVSIKDKDGDYIFYQVNDMVVQGDGKIVVLTTVGYIIRYKPDGDFDLDFGTNGIASIQSLGVRFEFNHLAMGKNGEIVLAGKATYPGLDLPSRLAMARLNSDGSYDTNFSGGGIRIVVEGDDEDYEATGLGIDPDNNLLVGVAKGFQGAYVHQGYLTKYKSNGTLDVNFSGDGVEITSYPPRDIRINAEGTVLYSSLDLHMVGESQGIRFDKILVSGSRTGSDVPFTGIYDANFQPDGKIVVTGIVEYSINDYSKIWVRRFLPDGSRDINFGDRGEVVTDFLVKATPYAIAVNNRRIYMVGDYATYFNSMYIKFGVLAAYDGSDVRMTCPNVQSSYPTDAGKCLATVTGINAIMSSSTLYANVKYKLEQNGVVIDEGEGGVSGKQFPKGTTKVTYSYTDITTQTCSFNVTVEDKEAPKLFCPVAIQINNTMGKCYGELTDAQLGTPIATDNCSGKINLSFTGKPTNGQYPIGETVITWQATDEAGNTKTCLQTITVIDNEKPTISTSNKNVNTDLGKCYAVLSLTDLGTPVTADNCLDGLVVTPPTLPVNNQFPKGSTLLIWTVTDASGNTATTIQTVTVTDNEPPKIENLSATPDVLTPPDRKMKDVTINYTTSDNCGVQSAVISNITSNELVDGPGAGNTSPDWEYVDANHVRLRAERIATGSGRIYTITITCTDVSGNVSTSTVNVNVRNSIISPKSGQTFIVNSTVNMKGEFWDKQGNTHTAKWLIDESATAKASVTEPAGSKNGTVTGSYKFTTPGVYKLQMNVTDQKGVMQYANTNGCLDALVVVYDPNGGYSYGGGWYYSNKGTLVSDPEANGDVSYGYTVNYYKGAIRPKGETQFKFGDFEFNAVNFDYLVVNGAYASFAGTGKITGGQSGLNFIMTVIDGQLDGSGIDKVRMKIYNKTTGQLYYDNQPGAGDNALPVAKVGDGSTVVISSATATTQARIVSTANAEEVFNVKTYPNPSATDFMININSSSRLPAVIRITNSLGQVVKTLKTGNKNIRLGEDLKPGIYMVEIKQGENSQTIKLIKY